MNLLVDYNGVCNTPVTVCFCFFFQCEAPFLLHFCLSLFQYNNLQY